MVGSYSTADTAADPYRQMNAAACRTPDDCWFGGIGSRDPTGTRVGAFHLHWDGATLRTVYNAGSGRGVTDIEPTETGFLESSAAGPRRGSPATPDPPPLESRAFLLQRIDRDRVRRRPVRAHAARPTAAPSCWRWTATDGRYWAVGGGAASGPAVTDRGVDGVVPRPPLAAVSEGGAAFRELVADGRDVRRRRSLRGRRRRAGDGDRVGRASCPSPTAGARTRRRSSRAWTPRPGRRRSSRSRPPAPAAASAARIAFTSPDRRLDGHQRRLALPLHGRHAAGQGHRPGVRRADHVAPERVRRAVRPRRAARRRLPALRAAAGRDRARGRRAGRRPTRCRR